MQLYLAFTSPILVQMSLILVPTSLLMSLTISKSSIIPTAKFLPPCSCMTEDTVPCNNSPWEPFCIWLDFKIAEIALETAMTKDQTNCLLDLVYQSVSGNDKFMLQNHNEIWSLWDLASQHYTRVSIVSYTSSFRMIQCLFPSTVRYMNLRCITTLSGIGDLTYCKTNILCLTSYLMLNVS